MKKSVYFFCYNLQKDPVASRVYDKLADTLALEKEGTMTVDGYQVNYYVDNMKNSHYFVRTEEVISHNYVKYLPIINKYFDEFDVGGIVNWHQGHNAPESILTVHTTGDIPTVKYNYANPLYMRNLLVSLENNRKKIGLHHFTVLSEATHWSGVPYNGDTNLITKHKLPLMDIEIGSSESSWKNELAIEVIANSLLEVFWSEKEVISLLCVGGIHFEKSFTEAVLYSEVPIAISHILANQWVTCNLYEGDEGISNLEKCIATIIGKVDAIIFHDNLKGPYKKVCRDMAEKLNIKAYKHKILKNISNDTFVN